MCCNEKCKTVTTFCLHYIMETSKNHDVLLWKNILPTRINESMNALDINPHLHPYILKYLGKCNI